MRFALIPVAFLACTIAARAAEPIVNIIAHRGESADAPENTLAAFRLAWERHDNTIELDVHLTKDGQLVVIHDADVKRVAGVNKKVRDLTLGELRQLDAGRWKDPKWAGEKLPTLDEVLATIPAHGRCFIEIKIGPEAVPAVAKAVRASGKKPEQLVIISFKRDTLAEAKRQMPELKTYYLSSFKKNKETGAWTPSFDKLIAEAKSIRADGLNLSHEGPIDAEAVRKIKAAGLEFLVWTVDDLAIAKHMIELGASGVTTNKAAWMKEQLRLK